MARCHWVPIHHFKLLMPSNTTSAVIGGLAGALIAVAFQVLAEYVNDIIGLIACFSYVACGLIAVWHYTTVNSLTLTGGQGVKLGMFAGVVGAIVGTVLHYVLQAFGVLANKEQALEEARNEVEAAGGQGLEFAEGMIEFFYGLGGIVFGLVLGVVMGLVGGAIGRAIWKHGEEEDES